MKIKAIAVVLILGFFMAYGADLKSQESTKEELSTQNQELQFVAVSEVTDSSASVLTEIKDIEALIEESDTLLEMQKMVVPYCNSIKKILTDDNYMNIESQNIRELQKMQSELLIYLKQLQEWSLLTKSTLKVYDENREVLKNHLVVWEGTYENALKESAPESILKHIQSVIKEIKGLSGKLKEKYDRTLTDTQTVATTTLTIKEIIEKLKETQIALSNRVFQQNSLPLLTLVFEEELSFDGYFKSILSSISEKYKEAEGYFLTNSEYWLYLSIVSFLSLIFVGVYNYLYRREKLFVSKASMGKEIFFFIGRPFATYTVLFTLGLVFVFSQRPQSLSELMLVFIFIPVIRIIQTVIKQEYYRYVYIIFAIYILQWLTQNAVGFEMERRVMMLIVNMALFFYVLCLVYRRVLYTLGEGGFIKVANNLLLLFLFLLVVSFAANFYGSVLLSSRIVNGVLKVFYSAMIFYALYVILTGYIVLMLRRRIATASYMLERYSKDIEKTTRLLIKIWMLAWWLLVVTKTVSLYPLLSTWMQNFLKFSFTIAKTTISIQSLVDFILIIAGTWILARLIRIVLEVEVFARFRLPRGVPTAITTTLNYVVIITGTIIAFSSLGVSPQQFALIFGALGVGIGFGLRNIIANFVSGIIMVFERPVQIGDTIEVDKTMGSVQSIGARSSTIKTFDGSEVIIPNADFIAKEIVNWTLSDEHRRKTIEFKVDLDNDIDEILKMMNDIALSHPNVLKDPEPLAVFKSFGEYYLEFKLYFWLSDNLIVAQSEINITIYRALKEAGVKMPVPKANLEVPLN